MRDYQQHFRTRRREIPKRKISVPFHYTPEFNLSEIPYPLIVISIWKLLSRASRYMSLHGVVPHTQSRNSWQVAMKLTLRLSDKAASSVFENKLVTLSQLLVWNLFFSGLVQVHRHYQLAITFTPLTLTMSFVVWLFSSTVPCFMVTHHFQTWVHNSL